MAVFALFLCVMYVVLQEARIAMWEALQDLKSAGKIRDIGVSNFNRFHLEQLIENPR